MFAFNLNNNNKNNNNHHHHHLRFCLLLKFFEFFIVFFSIFFLFLFSSNFTLIIIIHTHTKIIHRFIIHTRISIIQSSHRISKDHFSLSLNTLNEKARWESVDDPGRIAMTMVLKTFLHMRYISILSLSLSRSIYILHTYVYKNND